MTFYLAVKFLFIRWDNKYTIFTNKYNVFEDREKLE